MKKILLTIVFLVFLIQAYRWVSEVVVGEVGYVTSVISDQRRYCDLYFFTKLCPLFYNKVLFYPNLLVKNYLTAISLNYLFLQRDNYVLELPLFLSGVYFLIQKKTKFGKYILFYFLLYPFFGPLFSLDWPANYWVIKPLLILLELYGLWNIIRAVCLIIPCRKLPRQILNRFVNR